MPDNESNEKKADSKVKAIIFDFWGTVVENGVFPSPIKQVKGILRIDSDFTEYVIKFEESFMLKKFDSLEQGFDTVCKDLNIRASPYQKELLIGLWNKNRLLAKPFPETIAVLKDLKSKKYKIALISNTDCFSVRSILEKYNMLELFDVVKLSYETGMLKSNAKVFEETLEELGVSKDEAVMIGDSLDSDIKGAENAGVRGILIDRKNRRDYEDKIISLKDIESKI